MSGIRLAAQTREIVRSSPTLMLYAMEHPADVTSAGAQKLDGRSLPAIALKVGQYSYTVLFDRKTKLPAAVRTRDDDNIAGDSNFDLVLSDWKAVGGVQMAHTKSDRVNGIEVARFTEKDISVNAPMLASAPTDDSGRGEVGEGAGHEQRAVSVGAAAHLPHALPRQRWRHRSGGRQPQARRACAERAARPGRHGEQPDRRHEGPSGGVRRALRRAAIALGDRRRQGQVSRQADQVPGADPPSHGSHRRHAGLRRRGRHRRGAAGLAGGVRQGRALAAHRGPRRSAEGRQQGRQDRRGQGHDGDERRHDGNQADEHSEPACRRHDHRPCGRAEHRLCDRPHFAARRRSAARPRRSRSAMRCARPTSPAPPSPAATAPRPSSPTSVRRWPRISWRQKKNRGVRRAPRFLFRAKLHDHGSSSESQ